MTFPSPPATHQPLLLLPLSRGHLPVDWAIFSHGGFAGHLLPWEGSRTPGLSYGWSVTMKGSNGPYTTTSYRKRETLARRDLNWLVLVQRSVHDLGNDMVFLLFSRWSQHVILPTYVHNPNRYTAGWYLGRPQHQPPPTSVQPCHSRRSIMMVSTKGLSTAAMAARCSSHSSSNNAKMLIVTRALSFFSARETEHSPPAAISFPTHASITRVTTGHSEKQASKPKVRS